MQNPALAAPVPPTREFTAVWIAYALFGLGALFWWPALLGVLLCHIRHGARDAGFIDAHYSWLARTFWWSFIGYLLSLGIIVAGAWPILQDILETVRQRGDWEQATLSIGFHWRSIFMTAGAAMLGAVGILVVWCWYVYRVLRGAFRLHDAQPAQ